MAIPHRVHPSDTDRHSGEREAAVWVLIAILIGATWMAFSALVSRL